MAIRSMISFVEEHTVNKLLFLATCTSMEIEKINY